MRSQSRPVYIKALHRARAGRMRISVEQVQVSAPVSAPYLQHVGGKIQDR